MIFKPLKCIGISYKKTDVSIRSKFALTESAILERYSNSKLFHFFIISTCNRTEIYSFDQPEDELLELLVGDNDLELFKKEAYYINDRECFEHLVEVTSGIDSQLLGDYEVSGQIKDALRLASEAGKLGGYFEKITNFAQSIAKTIRSETKISKGSVSVSNAAVEYIKQNVTDIENKSILVIGAGKMGRATMRNIISELDTNEITLLNRTESVSDKIAKQLDVKSDRYSNLKRHIKSADIIIVATNADYHIINFDDVDGTKVILDLSVPQNVDPIVGLQPLIKLIDVDRLSKTKDETLKMRQGEIPKAKEIMRIRLDKFELQINNGVEFVKKYIINNE
jgi:glutamyl-tRNA reductase